MKKRNSRPDLTSVNSEVCKQYEGVKAARRKFSQSVAVCR